MRKSLLLGLSVLFLMSCSEAKKEESKQSEVQEVVGNVADKSFDELFTNIPATDIKDNVFKLVGQDYTVITAGNDSLYNSMTASYGGWGQLFDKPTTWCFLRANRYTLEVIKKEQTYTMSYFADNYKDQVLFFGSKTGRNSEKMKENTLTKVSTPSGNISYKEARLIIECKLIQVTSVNPDDFYTEEGRRFVVDASKESNEYHKVVFGEITNVWIKK